MKNSTVLVLGSTGMAGHMVYYYLESKQKYNLVNVVYRKKLNDKSIIIDIKSRNDLEKLILEINPGYIINCIGILIKGSEDAENAVYINAYFPHFLKKVADRIDAKLIHISTDCVFSGKEGNYKEDSFRDADDVYGRSKALGEIFDNKHLTIRTSIIGPELKSNGEGLFHWFMTQSGQVNGYTNAIWGGVTTLELAKAIDYVLSNDSVTGLVHLSNGEQISKYKLLQLIKNVWNKQNVEIRKGLSDKTINKSISKSEILKYPVPAYTQMINEQFTWMVKHKDIYKIYTY